ncbi:LPS assembly lipoprotein LptE [Aliiruegeria lutimaris]|uniref:LPS-assembly lipoprotein n=1 Tax=Aliiruegeria lutimaris TaxID=571298 RepID=A0A1G8M9H5_9RHOB|nr:LPS assembly lipoprotein LptE [Aliiruegeria lutimaris]SDI64616.1 LPS-assembly lipoprotein [Aliiruegeria lutimaris]
MSLSDRRTFLAALAASGLTAGCGFTPAYAPGGAGDRLRGQLTTDPPYDKPSYVLVDRIETRLSRNDSAPYRLTFSITYGFDGLAVSPDGSTYRYHLTGTLDYTVVDQNTQATVTSGTVRNFVAYSALGTTVATSASAIDARERLMIILADQVVTELMATAQSWLP